MGTPSGFSQSGSMVGHWEAGAVNLPLAATLTAASVLLGALVFYLAGRGAEANLDAIVGGDGDALRGGRIERGLFSRYGDC